MKKHNKGKPIFGLNKIPDNIIIENQEIEIGKLNSYILELEDKLKGQSQSEKLSEKDNVDIVKLRNKLTDFENKYKNKSLKYEKLLDKYVLLNKKFELLQKQLISNIK